MIDVVNTVGHLQRLAATDHWVRLDGEDASSSCWRLGWGAAKLRRCTRVQALSLVQKLELIHGTLQSDGWVPDLLCACFDGSLLGLYYSWIDSSGHPDIRLVGEQLGRVYKRLGERQVILPAANSLLYVGEHENFAPLVDRVEDAMLRSQGQALLKYSERPPIDDTVRHVVHRDLHPRNVLVGSDGIVFIDWEMAHLGLASDDLAMTLLMWVDSDGDIVNDARDLLLGYRAGGGDHFELSDRGFRSSIALSGLRQGIAGWFSDKGVCTADYWPRIRHRTTNALALLEA